MKKFGWDICYSCNYQCIYCNTWKEQDHNRIEPDPGKWILAWERIRALYGICSISVSGGEPSVHPAFHELIAGVSKLHKIFICTNFSFDMAGLLSRADRDNLVISPTFHPLNADSDYFFKKIVEFKKYIPCVNFMVYPGTLTDFRRWRRAMEKNDIPLNPLPVRAASGGGLLNSEEEIAEIKSMYSGGSDMRNNEYLSLEKSSKGSVCATGKSYAMVRPDGHVDRCPVTRGKGLGNLLDNSFEFLADSAPCENKFCFVPLYLNE